MNTQRLVSDLLDLATLREALARNEQDYVRRTVAQSNVELLRDIAELIDQAATNGPEKLVTGEPL